MDVRARRSLMLVWVAIVLVGVIAPAVAPARPSSLRFVTGGLSCSGGVCALATGTVGASYGQNIAITGASSSSMPVFTVVSGSLPPGLSMSSTAGCCGNVIGGTPTQAGTFTFTVQVRDSAGHTASQAFSIAVSAASGLRFLTDGLSCSGGVCALASGNVGASYGQNIAIDGASSQFGLPVFTIVSGSLPPGLFMPSTYGCCGDAIGGTPTQAGAFTFTVEVSDVAGHTATQAFSIAISPPAPLQFTFPATCCNAGTLAQSYLQNFFISGGVGPYSASIAAGALPPGLALSAAPPISITGTPTTAGTFTFTVKVTDSRGAQATMEGSITVT
jgi:hypothetical protein